MERLLMTATFNPIDISPKALDEINNIFHNKNIPSQYGLRIGVKGAGCSGVSYLIGFDLKKDGDEEYLINNIPVFIEKKHLMYVIGLRVDFIDEVDERGFIFLDNKVTS
jgi:iron-sulfur cluster assembly protein